MREKMQGEFHIHIDAHQISNKFETFVREELKFYDSDFSGHPEGILHFETPRHLTYKTRNSRAFKVTFDRLLAYLDRSSDSLEGYVEGEYIPLDIEIAQTPFNADVPIPCQWQLGSLPSGKFREDEIHITFDRDRSDPRAIAALRSMGFFSAYMSKPYGTAEILTVQGTRQVIQTLLSEILPYLKNAGGVANCSIKEERAIRWWMSSPSVPLPPVVRSISMRSVSS
ncbi:hypothetical protein IQ235_01125 [Oscillatoriales cyanobacterium LEGE 11467]|uniref:Uncharacterized protein n=1 Tax=Zarconia navalis LEGE 11467 TaxID=1828826 RepID=A0A928Z5K2_9CYAN|nr:hypothetical protein [Zarconia navalis]MBE9039397.1 hypothetical protein [Zarconia navalis LEGE 11467]